MAIRKKNRLRRWITRILLFIILFPIGTLVVVRTAGLFKMRKTDNEIMSFLRTEKVSGKMDTIQFGGFPIVYLQTSAGEKKKDAILFVHGSPGSMDACLNFVVDTTLLSRADLITFDRPGFGHSKFGTSLPSLSRQSDVLEALMDSLHYDRYWLVGHSYGGPIIVDAAIRHPGHIAGICIVAGSISPDLEPKASWRKWLDLPLVRQLLPTSMRVSNEELMPLKRDLEMIEDDWGEIHVPVSIIHGTKDVLVPFENLAYAQEKLVNAKFVLVKVIEGESHFIFWTKQPMIVEEIIKLMEEKKSEK